MDLGPFSDDRSGPVPPLVIDFFYHARVCLCVYAHLREKGCVRSRQNVLQTEMRKCVCVCVCTHAHRHVYV